MVRSPLQAIIISLSAILLSFITERIVCGMACIAVQTSACPELTPTLENVLALLV
jgi:hypothetical protein